MARSTGPLFSLDASGSIGGAITYSKWKGRNYVRRLVIPSNPRSGAQVGRRAMFTFLSQKWDALATVSKASWEDLADEIVASRFNAFMKHNMARWHNFLAPGHVHPTTEEGVGSDDTLLSAAWEQNRIHLDSEITAANQAWGSVLFASLSAPFTPAVGNAIMVVLHDSVDTFDMYWTPPEVDTWYFNMRPFSSGGMLAAATGEVNSGAP